jgi:hypothetical protein
MKIYQKDFLKIGIIFTIWFVLRLYALNNNYQNLAEALKYFPMHAIFTLAYYAVCKICYNILFINDCKTEYTELLDEIESSRTFFEEKGIKYN